MLSPLAVCADLLTARISLVQVEVHYEGTLVDGTVFDSSYARGEPISFPLSGVIRGWTEGLQLMKPGKLGCPRPHTQAS